MKILKMRVSKILKRRIFGSSKNSPKVITVTLLELEKK